MHVTADTDLEARTLKVAARVQRHLVKLAVGAGQPRRRRLCGFCTVGAVGLVHALEEDGIEAMFVAGRVSLRDSFLDATHHCWVWVPEAFQVLCITSLQFYLGRVFSMRKLTEDIVNERGVGLSYTPIEWGSWGPRFAGLDMGIERYRPSTYAAQRWWAPGWAGDRR